MQNFPGIGKLDFKTRTGIIVLCFILVCFLGLTDFLSGYELSFSIFYMIPVSLVTWAIGLTAGLVISLAAGVAWFISDMYTHPQYSHFLIPYWNAFVRLCFFLIMTYMLAYIKRLLQRERQNARTDPLTGSANILAFYERADLEIERARRYSHPLTVAYIDIDNFKALNDTFGHYYRRQTSMAHCGGPQDRFAKDGFHGQDGWRRIRRALAGDQRGRSRCGSGTLEDEAPRVRAEE
jgi:hypothetical protein